MYLSEKIDGSKVKIMFAIAFDLDTDKLKKHYPSLSWQNVYGEIRGFLAEKGFENQQGSLYYGNGTVTQVSAILAVVELSKRYPYVRPSVADIRLLQLLNKDDLMPAIVMGNP
jgi:virulence-associated protein VapD